MTTRVLTLVDRRYRSQAQPSGMIAALRDRGAHVEELDETQCMTDEWRDVLVRVDVAVARGRRPGTLAVLADVAASGIPVVDTAAAVEQVRDKRIMTRLLRDTGLARPRTVICSPEDLAGVDLEYPIIVKPVFGDNAEGIVVLEEPADLLRLRWRDPELIAQEYRPGSGADLKLYVIEDFIAAVRRPSPISPCTARSLGGVTVNDSLREIVNRVSKVFGLRFFGVDCLEVDGRLEVLEVNDFPNYSSVPNASEVLARRVLMRAVA